MVTRKLISLLIAAVYSCAAITPSYALAPESDNRKFKDLSAVAQLLSAQKGIGQSLEGELARVHGEVDRAVQDGRFFAMAGLDQMSSACDLLEEGEPSPALVELFFNNIPGADQSIRRNLAARLSDARFRSELHAILRDYWTNFHKIFPRIDRPFAIVISREGRWGTFFARDASGNVLRDKDNKPMDLLPFAGRMHASWAIPDTVYADFQLALFAQRSVLYLSALRAMLEEQTGSWMDDDDGPSIQALISDFLSFQPRQDFISNDARVVALPESLHFSDSLPSVGSTLTPRQKELEEIFKQRGYVSVLEFPLKQSLWGWLTRKAPATERHYSLMTQTINEWDKEPADEGDYVFYSRWWNLVEGNDMVQEETQQAQKELEQFLQSRGIAFKPCPAVKGLGRKLHTLLALLQAIPMEYFNGGLLKTIDFSEFDTYSQGLSDGEYNLAEKAYVMTRSQIDNTPTTYFIALAAHELTHWLYATLTTQALSQEEKHFFEDDMLFLRQADAMLLLDVRAGRLQLKDYLDTRHIGEWIAEIGMTYLVFPDALRRHIEKYAHGTPIRGAWDSAYNFYKNRMFGGREFITQDAARLSDALAVSSNLLDAAL